MVLDRYLEPVRSLSTAKKAGLGGIVAFVLAALGLGIVSSGPVARPIEIEGAAVVQVRAGMSEADAIRALGMPPGDYRTKQVTYHMGGLSVFGPGPWTGLRGVRKAWLLDSKYIAVYF